MVMSFVPGCAFFDFDGEVVPADPDELAMEREPGTGHIARGGVGYVESCIFSGAPRPMAGPLKRKVIWMNQADVKDGAVEASLIYVATLVSHLRGLPGGKRPKVIAWRVGDSLSDKGIAESYVAVDGGFEDEAFDFMYAPDWLFKRCEPEAFVPDWLRKEGGQR